MASSAGYMGLDQAPTRDQIDARPGWVALEFGTDWCGHCRAAQPLLVQALGSRPHIVHLKVEDGKGRALGRSFQVKQWPTVVLLHDGVEVDRMVRPQRLSDITRALDAMA